MIPKVFVRSPYNYDVDLDALETALECRDESLAKQSFAEECDINTIVRRFGLDYKMPEGVVAPSYGDFTGVSDYHSAANAIAAARESFDALPAHVRSRFKNDPGAFVDFCSAEKNRAELETMGLVVKKPAAPAPSPAAPAPVAPASSPVPAAVTPPA